MEFPWRTKGIVLTAPLTDEIDDVVKLIDEYLAPRGFNLIILQVRYRYQFKSHPEVWGYDPLSCKDVKRLLEVCRKNNIRLVPKMNLIGHQSGNHNEPSDGILHGHNNVSSDTPDGLLRAYPHFSEEAGQDEVYYARSICLSCNEARKTVCELIGELMDVFEADAIHIGCDEAFGVGKCEKCISTPVPKLIANWVNGINQYVRSRGGELLMWGDRLLPMDKTDYDEWESSNSDSHGALELLDKNIIICDWHYNRYKDYASIEYFGNAGFKMLISPWREKEAAQAFINCAKEQDKGHVLGILATTWCGSGDLAKKLLYGEKGRWLHTDQITKTMEEIY